jgi:hypothetical protein
LRSPRWVTPIMSFVDEYSICFDTEDENKLEYTSIHDVKIRSLCQISDIAIQKDSGRAAV